jgi:hypothetical protein
MGHVSGAARGPANGGRGCAVGGRGRKRWDSVVGAEAELAMDRALALRSAGGRWAREGDGSRGVEAGGMMQSTARGQANPSLHLTRACGALLYRGSLHCRGAVYTWGCTPHGAGR